MNQDTDKIKFYSDFNEKIKNELGILFYDMLSETLSDQDLSVMVQVLNAEKETSRNINNQIKETAKSVAFTIMLLYGEDISIKKKEINDNKDELLSLLNSIEQNNQDELLSFIDGTYDLYTTIKNQSLWSKIKFRRGAIASHNQIRLFHNSDKKESYYNFLVDNKIVKETFLFSYIKKSITQSELAELCSAEKEKQNLKIKSIKNYLEKHPF